MKLGYFYELKPKKITLQEMWQLKVDSRSKAVKYWASFKLCEQKMGIGQQ